MPRSLMVLAATLIGMLAAADAAFAEYSLCNRTSYAVRAAIGYPQEEATETRGWWSLRPGQCRIVLTEKIGAGDYFVFAEAIVGHRGNQRVWAGSAEQCVAEDGFFTLSNNEACEGEGRRMRNFSVVNVTEASDGEWRTDFTEVDEYATLNQAETAGVQRLLSDVGYDVGDLDGYMGQKTRDSLADFKRRNNLADPSTVNDELLDALILAANTREKDLGLYFCNAHSTPIWTALAGQLAPAGADPETAPLVSRGWWRLNPDQCAKIIKGAPEANEYFIYASTEESQERSLAGGDRQFCVNSVLFEIEDGVVCEDEGYAGALFKRVAVDDAETFTYRFRSEDFADAGG